MNWLINKVHDPNLFESDRCNTDARRADKKIKFCNSCKRCWEYDKASMRNLKQKRKGSFVVKHYQSFPTYGKKREKCEDCKGNNE